MVLANGLIVLPEEATFVSQGTGVPVQLLDKSLEQTEHPEAGQ